VLFLEEQIDARFLFAGKQRPPHRRHLRHTVHCLLRTGPFRCGVQIEEEFRGGRVPNHGAPIDRRLPPAGIVLRFIGRRSNEIERQTLQRER